MRAARAPIAPATGAFLKAAPVVEAGAEDLEALTLAVGVPEVAGFELAPLELGAGELGAAVPEVEEAPVPEGAALDTMDRETVSIQGRGRMLVRGRCT